MNFNISLNACIYISRTTLHMISRESELDDVIFKGLKLCYHVAASMLV